jgi:hypothetical protein
VAKNFWSGTENPLRKSLVSQLSKLNIKGAESLVDRALASSVEDLANTILAKAEDLSTMSVETRNTLASLVVEASYTSKAQSEEEEVAEKVTSKLSNGGLRIMANAAPIVEEVASSPVSKGTTYDNIRSMIRRR